MKIVSFYDLSSYTKIKEVDKNDRDIRLYRFNNVTLSGLSPYYPDLLLKQDSDSHLILPTKEMTMSLNRKSYYEESGMEYDYKPNLTDKTTITTPVYYFIYNTENYFHFIYDTLPYLYCYLQLRKSSPTLKLLMNYIDETRSDHLQYIKETLQLLGINSSDIIIHKSNNKYKTVYLSSSLTHNGLSNSPPREELFEIYDLMISSAREQYAKEPQTLELYDKIYVSRRTTTGKSNLQNIGTNYTNRRRLMNEDQLVNTLEEHGFKEIFGENYSFLQKVILFNSAKEVIGAIGGTIINTLFCNSGCKIICLVSPDFLRVNGRIKYPLLKKNVTYFEDTSLTIECTKSDKYADNVRVKIKNSNQVGEIESYDQETNSYKVKLSNGREVGWSEEKVYETVTVTHSSLEPLDYGLNSPWYVNIDSLFKYL